MAFYGGVVGLSFSLIQGQKARINKSEGKPISLKTKLLGGTSLFPLFQHYIFVINPPHVPIASHALVRGIYLYIRDGGRPYDTIVLLDYNDDIVEPSSLKIGMQKFKIKETLNNI